MFRVLAHVCAITLFCLVFSFALFLGLQVEPLYGNVGLALTAVLVATYLYLAFDRRK